MKSILQQLMAANQANENGQKMAAQAEMSNPLTTPARRNFLKRTALGGISLAGFLNFSLEDTLAQSTAKVNRASNPSELKITDMRYATVSNGTSFTNARNVIIRIDTNQGIYGLGEVRDGGDARYALFLKSRLLGQNPCNVEMLFKTIKQFGNHGRLGGGVSGVEMALWDLAGKAYGVPVWQLLGGRYRDQVRLYSYVPGHSVTNMDVAKFKADIKHRMEEQGFTWLKMHPGIQVYSSILGTTVNTKFVPGFGTDDLSFGSYQSTRHPFTAIQVTDKGLDLLAKYVDTIRSIVGYEVPLSADHMGHFDVNNCIRVARALEPFRMASLEDFVPWDSTDQLKTITDAITTPTMTGEDIYLKETFQKLCDVRAVDIVQPDMGSSGGILETKKIGDYAEEKGVAMGLHFAGTPVCFMANVHSAAATQNVLALEVPNQIVDNPWWPTLVKMVGKQPLYTKGFAHVPLDAPGLGVELNDEVMKQHLHKEDTTYFRPTPEWNEKRSHDRIFS
ncbi:mandelate racemase/muconate lactonizing enzyme family protein [Adhaeribacter radiodurans]|uniref:Mandelate racemase/muconate lactonizing enzyme family protein n=1 Tax=Adhaeribacter radiodurans TaxID=2745197 RepID=A0A7L7L3U1_9BACT|nr:mandelate racemase/muconate lactonizing enzyme family protein [Adhaeribacter radiodurans]QMU27482.1 mandelate racemase/muconate lactonizing enzyme family protein [Adhaeribacter radiodurans]